MDIEDIKNIAVIGAGNMGHQISLLCAIHGFTTTCTDTDSDVLRKAEDFAGRYLQGRVQKGKMTETRAQEARRNISFTADLRQAVAGADYIIEAIVEVLDIKRQVFAELDRLAPRHAVLATNSSYLVSSLIADVTSRPDRVLNLHFFNPALVMKLVEIVKGPHVSDATAQLSMNLCTKLEKVPVLLHKEVEGFLLNRIIKAIRDEAVWLLEMGVASPEDIDNACIHGAGHPLGPFRLMDLTGIDLSYVMSMERFRKTGDPADLPAPSVVEKYVQGRHGRKTGRGWYDYADE